MRKINKSLWSKKLFNYQQQRRLSKKEMCDLCGVSYKTLRGWLRGEVAPHPKRAAEISNRLGIAAPDVKFNPGRLAIDSLLISSGYKELARTYLKVCDAVGPASLDACVVRNYILSRLTAEISEGLQQYLAYSKIEMTLGYEESGCGIFTPAYGTGRFELTLRTYKRQLLWGLYVRVWDSALPEVLAVGVLAGNTPSSVRKVLKNYLTGTRKPPKTIRSKTAVNPIQKRKATYGKSERAG